MKYLPIFLFLAGTVSAQSVWTADFVQSKPNRQAQTIQYFERGWASARLLARQAGYIQSYRLLQIRPDTANHQDFDIILLTEYPNEGVYAKREENFRTVFRQMPNRSATGPAPAELRDIRLSKTLTEPLPATDAEIALDATLRDYLDGGTNGDTTRLIRAFHPSATMKYVDGATGQFKDVPIADYLNRAKAGAGKTIQRTTHIAHRELTGTAAQARVESDYPTFRFIDYFNLLLIDGHWQIVSKIFYRQEKAVK